jgi:hypothetical protein
MVRSLPDLSVAGHPWEQQAADFVRYYDVCYERRGDANWLLGLFMAQQWCRMVSTPLPDLQEARLLLQVLEAERRNQGTAWSDLYFRVGRWIGELEAFGKGP